MKNDQPETLEQVKMRQLLETLRASPNKTVAAKRLGIDRGTVNEMCRRGRIIREWRFAADSPYAQQQA